MKVFKISLLLVLVIMLCAAVVLAAKNEASSDKGKKLFNDPKLGAVGKSCNDCHPNGKGLEKAGAKKDLVATINMCITKGMKGKALGETSVEMQSMVEYIKAVGKKKKKAMVGC